MRVIVCGAGRVGYGIAERLSVEQVDVTLIDPDMHMIHKIQDDLDVRALVGHGSYPDILAMAGAAETDMIIAVTNSDEINMVACQIAHSHFNIPIKIARIRSQSYLEPGYQNLFSRGQLAVDMVISPEIEAAEMVLRRIAEPGALDVIVVADGHATVLAVECHEDCPLLNTALRQLSKLFPDLQSTVIAIKRNEEIFIPSSDDDLQANDIAYITVATHQVRRTLTLFGHDKQDPRRIVIVGGGNIGLYVARNIEKNHKKVKIKIIERDYDRAHYVANQLGESVVLHGNALDQTILQDALGSKADLLIALTNQEQVNLLTAMIAKRLGCRSNMVLINNPLYEKLGKEQGVDSYINPSQIAISRILQQVRRGRIRTVYSLAHGRAEIIEGQALATSSLVGKPVAQLELSHRIRLGAIYRNGEVIRPTGSTRIQQGDWVVILALAEAVHDVEQLFRVSLEFF